MLANTYMEVVLGMLVFPLPNADVGFVEQLAEGTLQS